MFYSSEILTLKNDNKLGVIWLAATVGPKAGARKLHRKELLSVNIPETCRYLRNPPEPLSLRLSANMMVGVTRVYGQQCQYQYSDVQGLLQRLTQLDAPQSNDLDLKPIEKTVNNITLKKIECIGAVNADLKLPDFDLNELLSMDNKKPPPSIASSSSSIASTPEQGRKGWSSSSPSLAGNDYLVPFSDAMSDFDGLTTASETDHFQSFLRPGSAVSSANTSSMNLSSELPFEPVPLPKKRRKLLHLFDDRIMQEKDELFLKSTPSPAQPQTEPRCKNPLQEAMNLLTCANDWLPDDSFTKILKDRFVPEIETFRALDEPAELFDDLSMPMPWHSDTDSVDDFKRLSLGSVSSVGTASPFMSSMASPFSTPSPKLPQQSNNFAPLVPSTTKSTLDFLLFLQERVQPGQAVYFDSVIEPRRSAVVARAFHHLLELKMSNLLQVRQSRPFSRIELQLGDF